MTTTLSILGVIAFVLFHVLVTLPLATLTSREIVLPWLQTQGLQNDMPEWVATVVLFFLMALAFALRGHVVSESAHHRLSGEALYHHL